MSPFYRKVSVQIITDETSFEIQPDDINASEHLWDTFGHYETEVSAGWIVRFLQKRRRGWAPFSHSEIEMFYSQKQGDGFTFNLLITRLWIVRGEDGLYRVTDQFIRLCHKSGHWRFT